MEERKREERTFVRENDTHEAVAWYIIDVRWLREWKSFACLRGTAPPGRVDNSRLVDARTGRIKPPPGSRGKWLPGQDYRAVNQTVWDYFLARYGGGPALRRRSIDLYAEDLPEDLIARIPSVPYDPSLFGAQDGRLYHGECPICLGEFGAEDEIKVPLCGHPFHEDCLGRWLRRQRTCALCRRDVAQGAPETGAKRPRDRARAHGAVVLRVRRVPRNGFAEAVFLHRSASLDRAHGAPAPDGRRRQARQGPVQYR